MIDPEGKTFLLHSISLVAILYCNHHPETFEILQCFNKIFTHSHSHSHSVDRAFVEMDAQSRNCFKIPNEDPLQVPYFINMSLASPKRIVSSQNCKCDRTDNSPFRIQLNSLNQSSFLRSPKAHFLTHKCNRQDEWAEMHSVETLFLLVGKQ